MSQRELGERVGVDQSAISSWERGAAVPGVDRVFHLDLAFGFQPGTLLVKAGLIKLESLTTLQRRSEEREPANVSGIKVFFDNGTLAEIRLPPKLPLEQWLELARTMIADEISSGAAVTKVVVVQTGDDYESSITAGSKGTNLEELLRLIEIMLEAQGEVEPPLRRYPAFDPSEEPF
jgi:transcriptional regulator with XRE-family HTH domain